MEGELRQRNKIAVPEKKYRNTVVQEMLFPERRLRRLRKSEGMRRLMRQTRIDIDDLVCPVIVDEELDAQQVVNSMPGIQKLSPDMVAEEASRIGEAGIPAILLFGTPQQRDKEGTHSYDENGVVQNAIRAVRKAVPGMVIMADVCMCQYTDARHCGIVRDGSVDNDHTIQILGRIATSLARAGADVVSPSSMMDGQVATVRSALDKHGHTDVAIMSQSAKHVSALYSPFRAAADSAPKFADRHEYQVPHTNPRESMMELESNIVEGGDMVMIKPAMAYLDLVAEAKRRFDVPVAVYNTSGEYAMVRAAQSMGWIDGPRAMLEILGSMKRAGADIIVTYFAKDMADMLSKGQNDV